MTKSKAVKIIIGTYGTDTDTGMIKRIALSDYGLDISDRTVQQARKDLFDSMVAESNKVYARIKAIKEQQEKEDGNVEYICEGCSRVADLRCTVYAKPPSQWVRAGCCFFNRPAEKKAKVRINPLKQSKRGH